MDPGAKLITSPPQSGVFATQLQWLEWSSHAGLRRGFRRPHTLSHWQLYTSHTCVLMSWAARTRQGYIVAILISSEDPSASEGRQRATQLSVVSGDMSDNMVDVLVRLQQ